MKKLIYIFIFLFSFSLSAQDLYWYDVILDVKNQNAKAFENAVDKFYSSIDFPEEVTMTFSNIALKGQGFKETHILSFVSSSASSLADFRSSLSGDEGEKYLDGLRPYINSARTSAGNASNIYNEEEFNPIGQAWAFKVKNKDIPTFTNAFKTVMETIKFPGFVGLARVTHGLSNGENLIIYGTYSNLNDAFTFETPKSEAEAKAFGKFFDVTGDISEFTQTWTRVKIKDYQ